MSRRVKHNPLQVALAALLNQGLDGVGEALRILVDEASKIERSRYLNAQPHERNPERLDYANGQGRQRSEPGRVSVTSHG